MKEQQLLDLGFKKQPYEGDENDYYLYFDLHEDLALLWSEDEGMTLYPYEAKITSLNAAKHLIDAFKEIK